MGQATLNSVYPGACCGKGVIGQGAVIGSTESGCVDCLFVPSFVYAEDENAKPCGAAADPATIDLVAHPATQISVAEGKLTWQIIQADTTTIFETITIDAFGVITFKFQQGVDPKGVYNVTVKLESDNPKLSVIAIIGIKPYNLCATVHCGPNEGCDPCSQSDPPCVPLIDIEVT